MGTALSISRGLLCGLLLVSLAVACNRQDRDCTPTETHAVVDPALMSFLSRARAAHHLADNQEQSQPAQALATLHSVLNGPRPGSPDHLSPEVREVLADTAARVADIESQLEQFENAAKTLIGALPWVPDASYYRGHVFEVLGLVEERRTRALEQQSNFKEAVSARGRAMAAFEESMKIQAEVIRTTAADAGK